MSSELSVAQVLAKLEAQMAYHRERESHHGERESFHQEKRAHHAAEYETVAHHYDAFKATAGAAAEIAVRATVPALPPPEPPSPELEDEEPPDIRQSSRLVARAAAQWPVGEPFTATQIAAEVNRLYPRELRQPVVPRLAATALRRLCSHGRIRLVQRGVPYHEAVYSRG